MRKLSLGIAGVMGAILIATLIVWRMFTGYVVAPASTDGRKVVVQIPTGVSAEALATLLHGEGLVRKPAWFIAYLDHFSAATGLKAGEYELNPVMSPKEIIDRLSTGNVLTYTFMIKPGTRANAVIEQLAKEKLGDKAALTAFVANPANVTKTGAPGSRIEGYLFPDAYNLPRGLPPQELLGQLVARYRSVVTKELLADAKKHGLTELQLVAMASLIESDNVQPDERSTVASVYHNRLNANMKLENPGSAAYGLRKPVGALTREDLAHDNPWNTYVRPGLPPTAINSPSRGALVAAARPVKTDALFFAPRGDGTHMFCPDEGCYRIALERWRKAVAEQQKGPK